MQAKNVAYEIAYSVISGHCEVPFRTGRQNRVNRLCNTLVTHQRMKYILPT
jgi:hypothetical protein